MSTRDFATSVTDHIPRTNGRSGRPTLAQLLAERASFEAGRRKRGVPPEGVLLGSYTDEDPAEQ